MTTLYDIGDEVEIVLKGKVKQYTVSESGDCYTIELTNNNLTTDGIRVYLDTPALKASSKNKTLELLK